MWYVCQHLDSAELQLNLLWIFCFKTTFRYVCFGILIEQNNGNLCLDPPTQTCEDYFGNQ